MSRELAEAQLRQTIGAVGRLEVVVAELGAVIRYMANTAHQAYHQEERGGWQECSRAFCRTAVEALEAAKQ